jgi:hypothetical protein
MCLDMSRATRTRRAAPLRTNGASRYTACGRTQCHGSCVPCCVRAGTCGSGGVNDCSSATWVSAQANNYASTPDVRAADGSIITYGNEHILLRALGNVTDVTTRQPKVLWMRIVNETTYRAWNPRHNGVKRQSEGEITGFFGAINLLGARTTSQRPAAKFWNTQYSLVQLRYEFYTETNTGSYEAARAAGNGMTGLSPQDIGRLFFTFWDIDQGTPTFSGSYDQIEALQMGPQAYMTLTGQSTEINVTTTWNSLLTAANVNTWLAEYGGNTVCVCTPQHELAPFFHALKRGMRRLHRRTALCV